MKKSIVVCLTIFGLLISLSLQAHHRIAGVYDMKGEKELAGTLHSIKFVSPHGSLTVAAKNPDGTSTDWVMSLGSPTSLAQMGIEPTSLQYGDIIKVRFLPAKDGSPLGFLRSVTMPDGHVVQVSVGNPDDFVMGLRRKFIWTGVVIGVVLILIALYRQPARRHS